MAVELPRHGTEGKSVQLSTEAGDDCWTISGTMDGGLKLTFRGENWCE